MKDTLYMKLKELWLAKQKLYRELRRSKPFQLVQSVIGSIIMPKK
jgi:hypothetical protein